MFLRESAQLEFGVNGGRVGASESSVRRWVNNLDEAAGPIHQFDLSRGGSKGRGCPSCSPSEAFKVFILVNMYIDIV